MAFSADTPTLRGADGQNSRRSIGGFSYGLRWPDPWPTTFGYHEFFHACTALAAVCQYLAMWYAVF
jgi:channel protein (hemolysin III family)